MPRPVKRLAKPPEASLDKIAINNKIRRQIKAILGSLTLFSDDPDDAPQGGR